MKRSRSLSCVVASPHDLIFTVYICFIVLFRSYKNGFVWHDLSEDDLILPAHGNEYVLKGSELFYESNSG